MPFVAPKETRDLYLQVHGDESASPNATVPSPAGNDTDLTPPPTDQPPQPDPASNNGNGPLLTLTPQVTNWATGQSQPVVPQEPTVDAQVVQGEQPDVATSADSNEAGATKGGYVAPESAREAYVKTHGADEDKGGFVAGPEARNEYINQLATGDQDPAHLYATGQEDDKDAVIQAIRQRDKGWDAMSPGQKDLVVAGNIVKGGIGFGKGVVEGIATAPQQVGNLAAFGRDLATIAASGKGADEIQAKAQGDLEAGKLTPEQFKTVSDLSTKLSDLDRQQASGQISNDQYTAQRAALIGPDTGQSPEQQRATREVVASGEKTGTGLINTGISVLQVPANIPGIGGLFPQATAADQAELAKKGILIPQTGDTRRMSDADLSQNLDILRARVQGQNEFLKGSVGAPGEAILGALNRGHPVLTPEQLEQQGQPVDPSAIEGGETAAGIAQMFLPVPGVEQAANLLARGGLNLAGMPIKAAGTGAEVAGKFALGQVKRHAGWGAIPAVAESVRQMDWKPMAAYLAGTAGSAAAAGATKVGGWMAKNLGQTLMDSASLLKGDASGMAEHGLMGQLAGRTAANAAKGATTMGLYAIPGAESPEDVGQAVSQGAVVGGIAGAPGVGLQSLRSRLFDSLYHGPKYDPKASKTWIDYGSDKGLDAQSKQMASDLSDKQQQTLNDLKHFGRGYYEAYYVDNPTFEKVVADGAGAKGVSPDDVKAAGIAMAPGPNGEPSKVFIRQGQLDNALFHETGHALWNWLPDDAKQSVISAGMEKNDPNDFTRWYVDRTSEGKIGNADYDSLPTQAQVDDGSAKPGPLGLTKDKVGEEIGAEQFNKLFQGQSPAQLTQNKTWQRHIQIGLGNVLEQMGVPTTTAEAQSKMGVQPSVASTLILDKFLREQMPPKSTIAPDSAPGPETGKAPLEIEPEARGQKAADYFASRGQRQAGTPSPPMDPEAKAMQNRQAVKSDLIKGGRMTPQEADQYVDVGPADSINQLYRDALMRKGQTDAAARDQAQAPPVGSQGGETPEAVPVEPKAEPAPSTPARSTAVEADAVAALQHLGIGPNEARDLVSKAQGGTAEEITTNALKARGGPGKTIRPSLPEVAPGMPQPKEAAPVEVQQSQPKRSPQEEAMAALNPDEQKLFQQSQTVTPEKITPEMVAANKKYSDALGDAFERREGQAEQEPPKGETKAPNAYDNLIADRIAKSEGASDEQGGIPEMYGFRAGEGTGYDQISAVRSQYGQGSPQEVAVVRQLLQGRGLKAGMDRFTDPGVRAQVMSMAHMRGEGGAQAVMNLAVGGELHKSGALADATVEAFNNMTPEEAQARIRQAREVYDQSVYGSTTTHKGGVASNWWDAYGHGLESRYNQEALQGLEISRGELSPEVKDTYEKELAKQGPVTRRAPKAEQPETVTPEAEAPRGSEPLKGTVSPAQALPKPPGFEMPRQAEPSKEDATAAKAQTPAEQAYADQKRVFEEDQARQHQLAQQYQQEEDYNLGHGAANGDALAQHVLESRYGKTWLSNMEQSVQDAFARNRPNDWDIHQKRVASGEQAQEVAQRLDAAQAEEEALAPKMDILQQIQTYGGLPSRLRLNDMVRQGENMGGEVRRIYDAWNALTPDDKRSLSKDFGITSTKLFNKNAQPLDHMRNDLAQTSDHVFDRTDDLLSHVEQLLSDYANRPSTQALARPEAGPGVTRKPMATAAGNVTPPAANPVTESVPKVPEPSAAGSPIAPDQVRKIAETAVRQVSDKTPTGKPKAANVLAGEQAKAADQAILEVHNQALSPDDPRVRLRINPDTGRKVVTGDRFIPGDAVHEHLLSGVPKNVRDTANRFSNAIDSGTPVHLTYESAEVKSPTGTTDKATRSAEQVQSTAQQRAKGEGGVTPSGKTLIPRSVSVSLQKEGNKVLLHGINPDKFTQNASHLIEALGDQSPYKGTSSKAFAEDLRGYVLNHQHGWKGDGSAPLQATEGVSVDAHPTYEPHRMDSRKADLLNAAMADTGAQSKTPLGEKVREFNRENQGHLSPGNEVNPLREEIDSRLIGDKAGELWSSGKLESPYENVRADLVKEFHENPYTAPGKIRTASDEVTGVFQKGIPNPRYVAAGFMPMLEKVREQHGQTGVYRLLRARMTVGQLEKEYGVTVPGADKDQAVTGQDAVSGKASFMPMELLREPPKPPVLSLHIRMPANQRKDREMATR